MLKWDTLEIKPLEKPLESSFRKLARFMLTWGVLVFLYGMFQGIRHQGFAVIGGLSFVLSKKEATVFFVVEFLILAFVIGERIYKKKCLVNYQVEFVPDGKECSYKMFQGGEMSTYTIDATCENSTLVKVDDKYFLIGMERADFMEFLCEEKQVRDFVKEQFESHLRFWHLAHDNQI